jgi:hypothetical protein
MAHTGSMNVCDELTSFMMTSPLIQRAWFAVTRIYSKAGAKGDFPAIATPFNPRK